MSLMTSTTHTEKDTYARCLQRLRLLSRGYWGKFDPLADSGPAKADPGIVHRITLSTVDSDDLLEEPTVSSGVEPPVKEKEKEKEKETADEEVDIFGDPIGVTTTTLSDLMKQSRARRIRDDDSEDEGDDLLSGSLFGFKTTTSSHAKRRRRQEAGKARGQFLDELWREWLTMCDVTGDEDGTSLALFLAEFLETSPMTMSALAGDELDDTEANNSGLHLKLLSVVLDHGLLKFGMMTAPAEVLDPVCDRITDSLRRVFVHLVPVDGSLQAVAITDQDMIGRRHKFFATLQSRRSTPRRLHVYQAVEAPEVEAPQKEQAETDEVRLASVSGEISFDLRGLPRSVERDSVVTALATLLAGGQTLELLANVHAPVVSSIQFKEFRYGDEERVGYELVMIDGRVRAERLGRLESSAWVLTELGDVADLELLGNEELRAAIVKMFGCRAVVDGSARWSTGELREVANALRLIPRRHARALLAGVSLIRDQEARVDLAKELVQESGLHTAACTHVGDSALDSVYDKTLAIAPPPHIHFFGRAFHPVAGPVGPPGAIGPRSRMTILHEVGHLRYLQYHVRAQALLAQSVPACAAIDQLGPPVLDGEAAQVFQQWDEVRRTFAKQTQQLLSAIDGYTMIVDDDEREKQQRAVLDELWRAPDRAEARERELIKAAELAGVPQPYLTAMLNHVNGFTARQRCAQLELWGEVQVRCFARIARLSGFPEFTEYSTTSTDEWFCEAYALYFADPALLCAISWPMFRYFESGTPRRLNWAPND